MHIIIVGGGYAGMIAAIRAKNKHNSVTILETNNKLGRKLLTTGSGRCNITNNKSNDNLIKLIHNGKFLYSTFSKLSVNTIINFYKENNLKLVEEVDNKMYPITQKASTVLKLLENKINELNIKVIYNTKVEDIIIKDNKVVKVISKNKEFLADHLILACGGLSYPKLGSDGSMHKILQSKGINIIKAYPVEASLFSSDKFIGEKVLLGISYQNISLKLFDKKKLKFKTIDDIIFTHKGLSGPAALKSSEHIYKLLENSKEVAIYLNFINDLNTDKLKIHLINNPSDKLYNFLSTYLKRRHIDYIYKVLDFDKNIYNSQISNKDLELLSKLIFNFKVNINKVEDIQKAFVSGGGVDLKEINPLNFTSKKYPNLSIIGELLDLHGPIGGYNLTIAFLSAYMAASYLNDDYSI